MCMPVVGRGQPQHDFPHGDEFRPGGLVFQQRIDVNHEKPPFGMVSININGEKGQDRMSVQSAEYSVQINMQSNAVFVCRHNPLYSVHCTLYTVL